MDKKQIAIKIISGLVISVFVLSFFSFTTPTQAANNSSSMSNLYANPNQSNNNTYKFKVSDVVNSNILTSVVGCTGVVNKVSTWMAKFVQSPVKNAEMVAKTLFDFKNQLKAACSSTKAGAQTAGQSIPTIGGLAIPIATVFEKLNIKVGGESVKSCQTQVEATDPEVLAAVKKQAEADASTALKEQCFDGIAITLAKNQLTAMTRSAVNWVNSGYGGNPFFVQNMTNLTNNIERNVLETGIDVLLAPDNQNPFASDFSKTVINGYRSGTGIGSSATGLLGRLQSDLGAFITDPKSYYTNDQLSGAQDTRTALQRAQDANNAFANDFSVGGWNGYLALTQRDQNNPLGFTMLASQSLADQQAQQVSTQKDELTQNSGFLNQKTCIKWQLYDEKGNPKISPKYTSWRNNDARSVLNGSASGPISSAPEMYLYSSSQTNPQDKCAPNGWQIITPGSIIKDKTTNYLNSPERQLELAKTINDSLNALFSVLISKLEGGGLAGLSDSVVNNSNWTDNMNSLNSIDGTSPYDNNGAYDGFNLTRDLGNTYIHEDTTEVGNWDANNGISLTDPTGQKIYGEMIPGYVSPVYINGTEYKSPSNVYWTVTKAGKTKLIDNGYNGWEKGDRAFWDGSEWQNWKAGQISPIKQRGVIQIQQDYIVAAKEILKVLPSVMTKLGELDYCLPGPNPSYKTNSTDAQSAYQDWIGSMYVGIKDTSGERYGVSIDKKIGDRTYDNLRNIYADNQNVWNNIKNAYPFTYLINQFSNICNDGTGLFGWRKADCSGDYFYEKNGNLSKEDTDHLAQKTDLMEMNQNYTNSNLFQNFYEVFDKMMNKLYFNNLTRKYNEYEGTPLDTSDTSTQKNSAYVDMSQAGYDLTKDIIYYNDDIKTAMADYNSSITQAKINISKLEPIKDEVSKIIKAAQDRRDANLIKILNDESTRNGTSLLTEAQYKTKYAGCLAEEDIQVFDVDQITKSTSTETKTERCNNGIDDDLDGLVDSKDPDCAGVTVGTTTTTTSGQVKHCVIGQYTTNSDNLPQNKKCNERTTEYECTSSDFYYGTQASMCDWTTGPGLTPPLTSSFGCYVGSGGTHQSDSSPNKNCLLRTEGECKANDFINFDQNTYKCSFAAL